MPMLKHQPLVTFGLSFPSQGRCVRARAKGFGPPQPPPKQQNLKKAEQASKSSNQAAKKNSEDLKAVLSDELHDKLGACSVVFIGDDSILNKKVAEKFAQLARYTPLDTQSIIQEITGTPVTDIEETEGRDTVVIAEASVIEQTALQLRCSISMLGGGWGAAARAACWRHLYGAFTVWLDAHPEQCESDFPQRGAYSEAEVHLKLGGTEADLSKVDDAADKIASEAVVALMEKVKKDAKIADGKRLYVKLGCRGDWPDIQPPEWQPPDLSPVA